VYLSLLLMHNLEGFLVCNEYVNDMIFVILWDC
jgi:hypothetical protein